MSVSQPMQTGSYAGNSTSLAITRAGESPYPLRSDPARRSQDDPLLSGVEVEKIDFAPLFAVYPYGDHLQFLR